VSLETPPDVPLSTVRAAEPRVLYAVTEMRPVLEGPPDAGEVIAKVHGEGYAGLMFWFGNPYKFEGRVADRIDDPVYEPLFSELERAGVMLTSGQIADPNGPFGDRQEWMPDPVQYWTQIRAFENVLARHPGLTVIGAYCAWIICQDGQVDFLRYLMATYPNLYVDLGAVCQYMHLVDRDNLREFYIEFADRILFGSDGGRFSGLAEDYADRYARFMALLETDMTVNGGYWGDTPTRGLDLPREVLEKIYYRNALRLYPDLRKLITLPQG
jgi:predicted TIM-barrel fold metal-dependent hydrolase